MKKIGNQLDHDGRNICTPNRPATQVFSYTSLADAYSRQGNMRKAVALVKGMQRSEVLPNERLRSIQLLALVYLGCC